MQPICLRLTLDKARSCRLDPQPSNTLAERRQHGSTKTSGVLDRQAKLSSFFFHKLCQSNIGSSYGRKALKRWPALAQAAQLTAQPVAPSAVPLWHLILLIIGPQWRTMVPFSSARKNSCSLRSKVWTQNNAVIRKLMRGDIYRAGGAKKKIEKKPMWTVFNNWETTDKLTS